MGVPVWRYCLHFARLKESLRLLGGSRLLVEKRKLAELGFMPISAQELLGQGLLPYEPQFPQPGQNQILSLRVLYKRPIGVK